MAAGGALVAADPKSILQRYLSDESTKAIAADYGVTRQALGQYLLKNAEQEWKDAQVARAIARREHCLDKISEISEAISTADQEERHRIKLSLACAELELRSAQWDLERVCRRIYGQDAPPNAGQAVQININLRGDNATKTVDAQQHAQIIEPN